MQQKTPAIWLTLFPLVVLVLSMSNQAAGQQFDQLLEENDLVNESTEPEEKLIHGVVIEQKKYSIVVRSGDEEYQIKLPQTAPVFRELLRPSFHLADSMVKFTLPCSDPSGDQSKNQVVELPLPETVYLLAKFKTKRNLDAFIEGRNKVVNHYALYSAALVDRQEHEILGQLEQDGTGFSLIVDSQRYAIELGGRTSLLSGFSILDLVPGVEVSLRAGYFENQWMAQEIQFQRVAAHENLNSRELPRVLSLGDMVSFSYQRALHEKFEGNYVVFHPPANCGGSDDWPLLNRWLGDYLTEKWDVIIFNTGMLDHQISKESYQRNLRRWIETIRPAGKRLIWLTTTPIQGSDEGLSEAQLVGKVPGRMKMQNEWAAEVLRDFQEVQICDLWQVVADGRNSDFKAWWASKRPQFTYKTSKLIADAIAKTLDE